MYFNYTSNNQLYLSLATSFLFIIALFAIGKKLSQTFKINNLFCDAVLPYQYVLWGSTFLNIIVQYVILFFGANKNTLALIGYGVIVIGLLLGANDISIKFRLFLKTKTSDYSTNQKLYLFILVCFFLVALAPITNADSLNYHLGVPLSILKNGHWEWHREWFHFGLAGVSENINFISLALNAEQLPNLIQFFSLASIIGLFLTNLDNKHHGQSNLSDLLILVFISTPILFFLASSPKPQLNGIALTSSIFTLILTNKLDFNKNRTATFFFFCILLFSACATKLNFFISSFFLCSIILFQNRIFLSTKINAPKNVKLIAAALFASVVIFTPSFFYRIHFLGLTSIKNLFIPVVSMQPGSAAFLQYLRDYSDSTFRFPLSIFLPSSFGVISMILGINGFILIYILCTNKFTDRWFLVAVSLFIIASIIIGQKTARFFFEPYIWLLLFVVLKVKTATIHNIKLVNCTLYLTSTFTIVVLFYAIVNLTSGIISIKRREITLEKNANGYNLAKWVNQKLPSTYKVLIDHKSGVFFHQQVYSTDWSDYVNFKLNQDKFYSDYLQSQGVSYVVLVSKTVQNSSKVFKYCDKLIAGPYTFKAATRNPFNSGEVFKAWIYSAKFH